MKNLFKFTLFSSLIIFACTKQVNFQSDIQKNIKKNRSGVVLGAINFSTNSLTKFDELGNLLSSVPITGIPNGYKLAGGISRYKLPTGSLVAINSYKYAVSLYSGPVSSFPGIYLADLNIVTGVLTNIISLNTTASLTNQVINIQVCNNGVKTPILGDIYYSFNKYVYRLNSSANWSKTTSNLVSSTSNILGSNITFDINNEGVPRMAVGAIGINLSNIAKVYKSPSIIALSGIAGGTTFSNQISVTNSNPIYGQYFQEYHPMTVDDNGNAYIFYNGMRTISPFHNTFITKFLNNSTTFNFTNSITSFLPHVMTDIEVMY
jgi:hypothetical protein